MTQCEWREVRSGDLVRVVRDQAFPCDLVLLASNLDDRVCYVETKNLDGETNLKLKRGVEGMGKVVDGGNAILAAMSSNKACHVECEHANNSLYTFTGNLDAPRAAYDGSPVRRRPSKEEVSLQPYNVLLRGSVAAEHGVRDRDRDLRRARHEGDDELVRGAVEAQHRWSAGWTRVVLAMLAVAREHGHRHRRRVRACGSKTSPWIAWYLHTVVADMVFDPSDSTTVGVSGVSDVVRVVRVPHSDLPVRLAGVCQGHARRRCSSTATAAVPRRDGHARCARGRPTLNEELGMVTRVLSDKTGTLTCNSMEFFKMSIAGGSYGAGVTEIERACAQGKRSRSRRATLDAPKRPDRARVQLPRRPRGERRVDAFADEGDVPRFLPRPRGVPHRDPGR